MGNIISSLPRGRSTCTTTGERSPFRVAHVTPHLHPGRWDNDLAKISAAVLGNINNAEAQVVRSAAQCRAGLVRQVSAPVRWQESVETLAREPACWDDAAVGETEDPNLSRMTFVVVGDDQTDHSGTSTRTSVPSPGADVTRN